MRIRLAAASLLLAIALVAVPGAAAEVTDRISVRGTGGNHVDGYSPTLHVVAVSPQEYRRGCCYDSNGGEWRGPSFNRPGAGSDVSTIDWGIEVDPKLTAVRPALVDALAHDWPITEEGPWPVRHVVGGKPAAAIPGTWILTRPSLNERLGKSAQFEAAIGFSICGRVAVARFSLLSPSSEEYSVKGSIPAATWNREQAVAAVRGVRLEGNLPVARVSGSARGRAVRGTVTDCHGHPVASVAVALEQRIGTRWKRLLSGRTTRNGTYALRATGAGTYRVTSGGRRSAPVRIS